MADIEQIKGDAPQIQRGESWENQKIDLGWKGYIPGYKQRWVNKTNEQIERDSRGINTGKKITTGKTRSNEQRREAVHLAEQRAENEEDTANQLAAQQEFTSAQNQLNRLSQKGKEFGKPSFFKYFIILFPLALVNDVIDIVMAAGAVPSGGLTILLAIVSYILTGIILVVMYLSGSKYKKAKAYIHTIQHEIRNIEATLVRASRLMGRASKSAGKASKLGGMLSKASKISSNASKLAKIARSPIAKVTIASILSFLPLMFISVYLAYRDEKNLYKEASRISNELKA